MDSTKVEVISHSFDKFVTDLSKPETNQIFDVLIPLLIGAALTFLAQWSIEWWKSRKDREINKRALISRGKAKTYLISQILKELAMYKAHKQYYASAINLSLDKDEENDFYSKHYEKGQEQRLTETKLSENIAEYVEIITEYQIISKKKNMFDEFFQKIIGFDHPKPLKFDGVSNAIELEERHSQEEKRLNKEYDKLRIIFNEIQGLM